MVSRKTQKRPVKWCSRVLVS